MIVLKEEIDQSAIIAKDISMFFSITGQVDTKRKKKNVEDFNNISKQLDLVDIYRTLSHQQQTTHSYFMHTEHLPTFTKVFLMIEILKSVFSDQNGIKLDISNRKKFGKFSAIWEITYT